ncbi:MAG: PhzF family phenazine biosynthesis protein [Verrucomicrobiota bacterium]|jgi:PhzF family phenazine biosynthesis protein
MQIPYFQVDAFTTRTFGGNPAGVCVLESWLPDDLLQRIAAENNLSETAFFTHEADGSYHLRWFTPILEVDLCGHATLASAHVLFTELGYPGRCLRFQTRSGCLKVERNGDIIELDFPARPPAPCLVPDELLRALGCKPREVLKSRDFLAVYESQDEVAALAPDMALLARLDCLGVIVTAQGRDADFVSRFFAPRAGVPEDPVTGSSHCSLIPFWAERMGRKKLFARQISRRGGELFCRSAGDRVGIGGRAVVYCRGELDLPVPANP